jgi:starch synthase
MKNPNALAILHVSREYAQIAEAGGVKDVVAGLATATASAGHSVSVCVPVYGCSKLKAFKIFPTGYSFEIPIIQDDGGEAVETVSVKMTVIHQVIVYLFYSRRFLKKRRVYTYSRHEEKRNKLHRRGKGHLDAMTMNLLFMRAVSHFIHSQAVAPDVVHLHDGHVALLPIVAKSLFSNFSKSIHFVTTVHNAGPGYKQRVKLTDEAVKKSMLNEKFIDEATENGYLHPFISAGIHGLLNTVSEEHAAEILREELEDITAGFGSGLNRRGIPLKGITNGIDVHEYDPRKPKYSRVPFAFDPYVQDLGGKQRARRRLMNFLKLPGRKGWRRWGRLDIPSDAPLFTFQNRITQQKGVEIMVQAIAQVLDTIPRIGFVIFGQGETRLEEHLINLVQDERYAGRVCFMLGYRRDDARMVFAAGDFFLIPSVYEPCGLTDFIAQLMGNIPIVHRVGGLHKVKHMVNGITYNDNLPMALAEAIIKAYELYAHQQGRLQRIRRTAIEYIYTRYTWEKVAELDYIPFYRQAVKDPVC